MNFHRLRKDVYRSRAVAAGAKTSGAFLSQYRSRQAVVRRVWWVRILVPRSLLYPRLLAARIASLSCQCPRRLAIRRSDLHSIGLFQLLIADSHSTLVGYFGRR